MFKYISIILLTGIISFSTNLYSHGRMHKLDSETIEKINQYKKDNIFPQMQIWKNKIDNTLSADELKVLNELRAKSKHFKSELMARKDIIKSDIENMKKKERKRYKKNNHKKIKSKFDDFKNEIKGDLKEIMNNNLELTEEIIKFSKENGKKWKEDIKLIVKDGLSEERLSKKGKHNDDNFRGKRGMGVETKLKKLVAQIYLFDGSMEEVEYFSKENSSNLNSTKQEVKISPNPFSSNTKIEFDLAQEELVIVSIYNSKGDLISILNNTILAPGKQSIEFNANEYNLSNGNYIYKIESLSINLSGNITLLK